MRSRVPWWWTSLGKDEIAGASRSIRQRHLNPGPVCLELEDRLARWLGVPYVVTTTSGSMALLLSLLACGAAPGDEVIIPAYGFIAAAHAARLLGAKVRLVDVRADRPLIDPECVARAIGARTRVIVAMHLNGRACDVAALRDLAQARGLTVIEDAAQALGSASDGRLLGVASDCGAFSMGITKLITTGEGGFVATRDPSAFERLLKLRNQGVLRMADNVFGELGFNFRFNDILAGVALAQLRKAPAKMKGLRRVYAFYRKELEGLPYARFLEVREDRGELPLWVEVLCADRAAVVRGMAREGIEVRPLHPCLADSPQLRCPGRFPNARSFADHGLILPSGPDQSRANLERTVRALWRLAPKVARRLEDRHA